MKTELLGGLKTRLTGGTDGQGGGNGPIVILLHGFGAPGDDLVPLADMMAVPKGTRFLFPEGPLSMSFGRGDARAWWLIDMARLEGDRAAGRVRDLSGEVPRGLPQVREAMEGFLNQLPRVMPLDFRKTAKRDWRPSVGKRTGLPVFQSHGSQDPILPYVMAERLRNELTHAGLSVEWHNFLGGHEIPEPVLQRLGAFLTKVLTKA
jgi:phospholipase/carboxylesterase